MSSYFIFSFAVLAVLATYVQILQALPSVWPNYNSWLTSLLNRIELFLFGLAQKSVWRFVNQRLLTLHKVIYRNPIKVVAIIFFLQVLISSFVYFLFALESFKEPPIILMLGNALFVGQGFWISFQVLTSLQFLGNRESDLVIAIISYCLLSASFAFILIAFLTLPKDYNLFGLLAVFPTWFITRDFLSSKKRLLEIIDKEEDVAKLCIYFEKKLISFFKFTLKFWLCVGITASIVNVISEGRFPLVRLLSYTPTIFTNWIVLSSFLSLAFWIVLFILLIICSFLDTPLRKLIETNRRSIIWFKQHPQIAWIVLVTMIPFPLYIVGLIISQFYQL